nr:carboxylesterase 1D-like [Aotus nancymaae]
MVWIHGGGLFLGGASTYDGLALAAHENVVVVTIQYRLGIWGFFSTGDEHSRGNWGHLDQLAALHWVQDNIASFGGNPGSVTIFGESAGGESVSVLVSDPDTSPNPTLDVMLMGPLGDLSIWLWIPLWNSQQEATLKIYRPLQTLRPLPSLHVPACDHYVVVIVKGLYEEKKKKKNGQVDPESSHFLLAQPARRQEAEPDTPAAPFTQIRVSREASHPHSLLLPSQKFLSVDLLGDPRERHMLLPTVIDGVVLPKTPEELQAERKFHLVPYMIGINKQEFGWILPTLMGYPLSEGKLDQKTAMSLLWNSYPSVKIPKELIPEATEKYLGGTDDPVKKKDLFLDLVGDVTLGVPSVIPGVSCRAGDLDAGAPTYMYEFQNPNGEGLPHWPEYNQKEGYLQIGANTQAAQKLKDKEVAFWTNLFAKKVLEKPPQTEHIEL